MKFLTNIFLLTIFMSCCIKKNLENSSTKKLSDLEYQIVNDFLESELNKELYKNYKNYQIVINEEALPKKKSIDTYIYAYRDEHPQIRKENWIEKDNIFFTDTLKFKKLQTFLKIETQYFWKATDFKNFKVKVVKNRELVKIINTGEYIILPKRKIIYLSTPLLIDDENAFISFDIGNGDLGYSHITHFTVLLKNINNKWVQTNTYFDGVFH